MTDNDSDNEIENDSSDDSCPDNVSTIFYNAKRPTSASSLEELEIDQSNDYGYDYGTSTESEQVPTMVHLPKFGYKILRTDILERLVIKNSHAFLGKLQTENTGRLIRAKTAPSRLVTEAPAKTFLKYKCSFSATVNDVMKCRGWIEQEDPESNDWNLYLCDLWELHELKGLGSSFCQLKKNQRVGHFRNSDEIARKSRLQKNLNKFIKRVELAYGVEDTKNIDFYPQSYTVPREHDELLEGFKSTPNITWILKPVSGAKGRGIHILKNAEDYLKWRSRYDHHMKLLKHLSGISSRPPTGVDPDFKISDLSAASREDLEALVQTSLSPTTSVSDIGLNEKDEYDDDDLHLSQSDNNSLAPSLPSDSDSNEESEVKVDGEVRSPWEKLVEQLADGDAASLQISSLTHPNEADDDSDANDPITEHGDASSSSQASVASMTSIDDHECIRGDDHFIVQHYISEPYLIGGKKFDLRVYVLVTSFSPMVVWVYREGFARFSAEQFSLTNRRRERCVHLTNVSVQRHSRDYVLDKGTKWSLLDLREYMTDRNGRDAVRGLMHKMDALIIRSLQSVQHHVIQDSHCFELFGFDVLIDKNLKPWLLEVNSSPAFTPSDDEDYEVKCNLVDDMISVLDFEKRLTGFEKRVGGFDLMWSNGPVYSEQTLIAQQNPLPPESDVQYSEPKLNSHLGCDNDDRENQLREIYRFALTMKQAMKEAKVISDIPNDSDDDSGDGGEDDVPDLLEENDENNADSSPYAKDQGGAPKLTVVPSKFLNKLKPIWKTIKSDTRFRGPK